MRAVVAYLDAPGTDKLLDAEDAFHDECGHGGRIDGVSRYRFAYLTPDGAYRWVITIDEHEIRAIVDGLQIEAEGERFEVVRTNARQPTGAPLLIWGAYNDDALLVQSLDDLTIALDTLRVYALDKPRIVRMWSSSDDQLVAVMWRDHCALYVIESVDGYATSTGDHRRTDSFEVTDHDGLALVVPWADCVAWGPASRALGRFAAHGELGPEIAIEGRIPSQLLMHGELDRQAVLAMRAEPARDPRRSSLPRLIPVPAAVEPGDPTDRTLRNPLTEPMPPLSREPPSAAELTAWGYRLLQLLLAQGLLELGRGPGVPGIDEIAYHLSGLLQAHGDEAEHVVETADWLANELGRIRGVGKLFATGGDLQLALRRSRAG
ncbi:MAG TPA: hypothetical protein VFP84_05735 [Kofleriaceae bacterium]|nr:hypothetical protein [Kofleriaceae bacterium]